MTQILTHLVFVLKKISVKEPNPVFITNKILLAISIILFKKCDQLLLLFIYYIIVLIYQYNVSIIYAYYTK